MNAKHLIIPLTHPASRALAAMGINEVPDGWVVEIRPPQAAGQRLEDFQQIDWISEPQAIPEDGMPACFDSKAAWGRYEHEARFSQWDAKRFCRDCNPERRNEMIAAGRCAYPETIFVVMNNEMIGLRRDDQGWFGALTGKYLGSGKKAVTQAVVSADRTVFERRETARGTQ